MKAKELMIGDIVMARIEDGGKAIDFPVVIDGLDENQTLIDGTYAISWRPLKREHGYLEYADYIEPIPLTKGILEKNGFEEFGEMFGGKIQHRMYLDDGKIKIDIDNSGIYDLHNISWEKFRTTSTIEKF